MPWTARDAYRHNKKASSPRLQRMWAHVANSELERGLDEGRAIAAANAAVDRGGGRPSRSKPTNQRQRMGM